jgi:NDP-sugar pyrophosphorylase family protein
VGVTMIVLAVSKKAAMTAEQLDAIRAVVRVRRVCARLGSLLTIACPPMGCHPQCPGVTVVCSEEETPMGTAGPLALARAHLEGTEPFFVFNSDVACEYPLADLLAFHRARGKEGTIMVTPVSDPSKYGVVVYGADGRITEFLEKPSPPFKSTRINAGLYVFNPSILRRIPVRACVCWRRWCGVVCVVCGVGGVGVVVVDVVDVVVVVVVVGGGGVVVVVVGGGGGGGVLWRWLFLAECTGGALAAM